MHLSCWYPGPQGMTPSQGLGLGKKPVISEKFFCTFLSAHTPPHISVNPVSSSLKTVAVLCWKRRQKGEKRIFFFFSPLPCSGSSSLQNEMLTSAFAFPSCCVLHWIRPEKQYHQAWSSIYQCSQDWFVTLPILGKWMSPLRSFPVQADLCFAHISHVM